VSERCTTHACNAGGAKGPSPCGWGAKERAASRHGGSAKPPGARVISPYREVARHGGSGHCLNVEDSNVSAASKKARPRIRPLRALCARCVAGGERCAPADIRSASAARWSALRPGLRRVVPLFTPRNPVYPSNLRTLRRPRSPVRGSAGRISTRRPHAAAPPSRTGLSPTISVRRGSAPRSAQVFRNIRGSGFS